jgi:hypothetical protein
VAKPAVKDLEVYQGDDEVWPMRLSHPPVGQAPAEPITLVGYTFRAQARARSADSDAGGPPLATFTVRVTDAAQGMFQVELPASESIKLTANCRWDLEMVHESTGDKRTLLVGDVKVTREVTRAPA